MRRPTCLSLYVKLQFLPLILMLFQPSLISTIYSSQIFKILVPKFAQPTTKHGVEHFISTRGPPIHAHACACLLTSSHWLRKNLLIWKPWVSYSARPAHGHHYCTWFPKHLADGVLVETTGASMMLLYLTAIQCRIYKIFLLTWLVHVFSPKLILFEVITRSL